MNNSNELPGQMCLEDLFGPEFSDGRTCQALYPAEPKRVQTLEKFYPPLSASSKKSTPIFLYLGVGGTTPDYWTEMDGKLLGVSWTPNTSEAVPPSDGDVCLLSRILEDTVPEKYYLSQRACLGIIRRSCKRGKTLPAVLMSALQKQAGLSDAELEAMKKEA